METTAAVAAGGADATLADFEAAINHVNSAVCSSDPATWFPVVVQREQKQRPRELKVTYDMEGRLATSTHCGVEGFDYDAASAAFNDAYSAAFLRIMLDKPPCALFAFPVGAAMEPSGRWVAPHGVDVIVGFVGMGAGRRGDGLDTLVVTPAWDGQRVYPFIGTSGDDAIPVLPIPPGTVWLLCASLDTPYRHAVSLYGRTSCSSRMEMLKRDTPPLPLHFRTRAAAPRVASRL